MRSLALRVTTNDDAILLLDFENAFNTADRNLVIYLTARMCPELTNLAWWLYHMEPRLITSRRDIVRSFSGTQYGCRLSNPLFALVMPHIAGKLRNIPKLRLTLFFWDDTAHVGTPDALGAAAKIINDCSSESGLRWRWKKCDL